MKSSDYHAHPALGSTQIRELLRSPAHFKALGAKEATPAMQLGTLVHTLVLEPDTFEERYIVAPKVDRRTKAGKVEWAEFQAAAGDREVIDAATNGKAREIAVSVRTHARAAKLLEAATAREESLFWEDEETGVECKCRPDARAASGLVVDLKTARDASPHGFQRAVASHGYHIQAAHYMAGVRAAGYAAREFLFVVVETELPYGVAVYRLDPYAIERGEDARVKALDLFVECRERGEWPGYGAGKIETIELPGWAEGMYE